MKKIIFEMCVLFILSHYIYAQGWGRYYPANNSGIGDIFELNDSTFLNSGYPRIFTFNNFGDIIWVSDSINGGYTVRTPDGGFLIGMRKYTANFELEWQILNSAIDNCVNIAAITPYSDSSGSIWYYTGMSNAITWGDFTSQPAQYPCFWGVNANGTHSSAVTILANFTETVSWINWGVGYGGDNDLVPKIDGDGLKVLANCNTHPCLIDVPFPSYPPYTKICYTVYDRLTSLIHASDLSGYVMAGGGTGGYAAIVKTNLSGNQQWIKYYDDGELFNEIIATTDGGYIAVGKGRGWYDYDDLYVAKTDINGNLQWQIKGVGFDSVIPTEYKTYEMATAVINTSDGGYLIGGYVQGGTPSNPSTSFTYAILLKIDSTGNCRPAAGFTHSIADYNLAITANTTFGADSYLWQFGNGDSSNLAMPAYTYPAPGSYNLCLIARNLCGNDTLCTVLDIATGTGQSAMQAQLQLHIYPNPLRLGTKAYWQATLIPQTGKAVLQVCNSAGQLVYSCPVSATATGSLQGSLPIEQWHTGVYYLQLITTSHTATQKMVVIR